MLMFPTRAARAQQPRKNRGPVPSVQARQPKRFHITLQVADLAGSVQDYCEILGQQPCCVIADRLALWRLNELNFLLRARDRQRTAVLQLGWEFDYLDEAQRFKDCNQLSWLFFATNMQDDAISRLNTNLEYNEENDSLLELRNPGARWNIWATALLLGGMLVFTVVNKGWLAAFFRPPQVLSRQSSPLSEQLQELYSPAGRLRAAGRLLEQAGYKVSYLKNHGVAQHPREASITFQIINQQVLFSTYWSLTREPSGARGILLSEREVQNSINKINREAVFCRYYQDEDGDLAVEAWFPLPMPLLLPRALFSTAAALPSEGSPRQSNEPGHSGSSGQALPQEQAQVRQQASIQWQKTLELWQQESLSWIQTSPLFGGELDPRQSFSKK